MSSGDWKVNHDSKQNLQENMSNCLVSTALPDGLALFIARASAGSVMTKCGSCIYPDSKVHGAHMGPIWGQQDPGGAVFDIAQILANLVHNMSRSQLYLGFGHFGWLPSFFGQ